jgi:hypothetical protein
MMINSIRSIRLLSRRRVTAAAGLLVAIVATVVILRFVYVISKTDSGWSMVVARWRPTILERSDRGAEEVTNLEPAAQAAYWLRNVDQIVAGPGNPAQLAMGAAWILDAPSPHYRSKHLRALLARGLPLMADNTESAEGAFEEGCGHKCLELAKRATEIEPANVNWWRMRALLTSSFNLGGEAIDQSPRTSDWADILEEAAEHDPDNAIYDYLSATQLWTASASYDAAPETFPSSSPASPTIYTLTVRDSEQFEAGVAHFEQAQRKKFVAFGEAGLSAIFEFLRHSGLPPGVQADLAAGSLCLLRSSMLILGVVRWQAARMDDRTSAGDYLEVRRLAQQCLKALFQVAAAEETAAYDFAFTVHQQQTLERLLRLAELPEGRATSEDKSRIARDLRRAKLRVKVFQEAARRAAKPKPTGPNPVNIIDLAVLAFTPKSVTALLVGGLFAWLAATFLHRRFGRQENSAHNSARVWWAMRLRDAGRSALALAAVLLLVDLALIPRSLKNTQTDYEERTLFFRHPEEGPRASREAIAVIEHDKATMDGFRIAVDKEVATLLQSEPILRE